MGIGDEQKLITGILEGNGKIQEDLYLKYRPRILREVYYSLGGGPDVEDLVGDVWGAVISSIRAGQFSGDSSLGAYIYGVTRNKIADYFKNKNIKMEEIPETYPDTSLTAEDRIEKDQRAESLMKEIRKLGAKYKKVIFLYYYRSLSVSEIAQRLNLPPSRVSEHKNYAIKKLRKILVGKGSGLDFTTVFLYF